MNPDRAALVRRTVCTRLAIHMRLRRCPDESSVTLAVYKVGSGVFVVDGLAWGLGASSRIRSRKQAAAQPTNLQETAKSIRDSHARDSGPRYPVPPKAPAPRRSALSSASSNRLRKVFIQTGFGENRLYNTGMPVASDTASWVLKYYKSHLQLLSSRSAM